MEYSLCGITVLILVNLVLTWLKDGEKMDPPFKRRLLIDLVTIALFWGAFEFFKHSPSGDFSGEIDLVVNGALIFFCFRVGQLLAQLNSDVKDLFNFLKKRGIKSELIDELTEDKKEAEDDSKH